MKHLISIILIIVSVQIQGKSSKTIACNICGSIPETENNRGYGISSAGIGILNDKIILIGGSNFSKAYPWDGGRKVFLNDMLIAEKTKDDSLVWLNYPNQFPVKISNSIAIGDGKSLYILGGFNDAEENKIVFKIFFNDRDSLITETFSTLPEYFTPTGGVIHNQLLYITGHDTKENLLYIFNPATGCWSKSAGIPGGIRSDVLTAILCEKGDSSKIYTFGGRHIDGDKLIIYNDFWCYSPKKLQWNHGGMMGIPGLKPLIMMAAPAIAFTNDEMYFFGGDEGNRLKRRFELEKRITKSHGKLKEKYIKKLRRLYVKHSGFSNTIISYNTNLNSWKEVGKTNIQNLPVATTAIWWRNKIILPAGELKPGIRSNNILEIDLNK